jgi:hypothetical protein
MKFTPSDGVNFIPYMKLLGAGGGIEWVPLIGGGGEVPFIKGMEREF